MELRQIRFFVAVAEDRHFGRAAERMYIAQPALSQHIRRLERELGVQLLDRSARHVRLTPAGEAFLEVARRMLRQVHEGTDAARRAEAGETGSLALGVHMAMMAPVVSILLRHWRRVRPAVQPRLKAGRTQDLVDLVRRRELDLALVDGPITDGSLECVPVVEDRLVVVLPAEHPLAREQELSLRSLRTERFVAVTRRSSVSLHDRLIELCTAAGFSPEIALDVDDPDMVPMAVAAGLGVGLATSASVAGTPLAGVVWRPLADAAAAIPLVAVSARDGATPQTRDFLQLLENLRRRSPLLLSTLGEAGGTRSQPSHALPAPDPVLVAV